MNDHLHEIDDALAKITELLLHAKEELRLAYISQTEENDD